MWRPLSSKMVMYVSEGGEGLSFINVAVDPAWPLRWQDQPYYTALKQLALGGVQQPRTKFLIRVIEGNRQWIILPNKDVEIESTLTGFKVLSVGPNQWDIQV
jgi:hypothetical protein